MKKYSLKHLMMALFSAILVVTLNASAKINDKGEMVVAKEYGSTDSKFYDEKNRGWFAYEQLPYDIRKKFEDMQKEIDDLKKKIAEKKEPKLKPLSAKWFTIKLDGYREKAIDNPTEQNVLAYKLLEGIMMDKSYNFAQKSVAVTRKYPALDSNSKSTNTGTFSLDARYNLYKNKKKVIDKLSKTKAMWFFYSSDCPYCEKQSIILKTLQKDTGITILPIALDGKPLPNGKFPDFVTDAGHAKQLGVMTVPALFLSDPRTNEIVNLSQGTAPKNIIVDRMIGAAKEAKWLSLDEYESTTYTNNRLRATTKDIKNFDKVDVDNLDEFVPYLINMYSQKGVGSRIGQDLGKGTTIKGQ